MRFNDHPAFEESLGIPFDDANQPLGLQLLATEQHYRKLERLADAYGLKLPDDHVPYHERRAKRKRPKQKRRTNQGDAPAVARTTKDTEQPAGEVLPDAEWPVSLHELIEQYKAEVYPRVSKHTREHIELSLRYYIRIDCVWDRHNPLQREQARLAIRAALVRENNSGRAGDNTVHKYFNRIRNLFDWIVAQKALDSTPMVKMDRPNRNRRSIRPPWEPMELEIILYWLEKVEEKEYPRDFSRRGTLLSESLRFLMLTGIRTKKEFMQITRENAASDYISVVSKVQPDQDPEDVRREIPVRLIPGLRECINRLLALPMRGRGDRRDKLWPYSSTDPLRKAFNLAVKYAGIPVNNRFLNCVRKTLENWLETEQGWHRQDVLDVVGHNREVSDQSYRKRTKGRDIEQRRKVREEQAQKRLRADRRVVRRTMHSIDKGRIATHQSPDVQAANHNVPTGK
jgi:hypothetical protein